MTDRRLFNAIKAAGVLSADERAALATFLSASIADDDHLPDHIMESMAGEPVTYFEFETGFEEEKAAEEAKQRRASLDRLRRSYGFDRAPEFFAEFFARAPRTNPSPELIAFRRDNAVDVAAFDLAVRYAKFCDATSRRDLKDYLTAKHSDLCYVLRVAFGFKSDVLSIPDLSRLVGFGEFYHRKSAGLHGFSIADLKSIMKFWYVDKLRDLHSSVRVEFIFMLLEKAR